MMLWKRRDIIGIPKFSMHVLHRICAAICIEGAVKPKVLPAIPGHPDIGMTVNPYVHMAEGKGYRAIETLRRLSGPFEKLVRSQRHEGHTSPCKI